MGPHIGATAMIKQLGNLVEVLTIVNQQRIVYLALAL